MDKLKGLIKLIRFELPFSAGICVVLGQMMATGELPALEIILFGFASLFFISASILVLNDYFDLDTDRINAPHRPIASNIVTPGEGVMFSLLLLAAGLFLSYLLGLVLFLISLSLFIIGYLYNRYFKKSGLPGNLMVSFSVGMTFIFGGASVEMSFNKIVVFFALIAALVDLGEEIAADSMDIEGDRLIDSKSLAIKHGREKALKISGFIFVFVILLTFLPFLLNWFSLYYLFPILIMDSAILFGTIKLLGSKGNEGRNYIRWIYLGATFGILIFLIMRLAGIDT